MHKHLHDKLLIMLFIQIGLCTFCITDSYYMNGKFELAVAAAYMDNTMPSAIARHSNAVWKSIRWL